jgi:hypothetical protein
MNCLVTKMSMCDAAFLVACILTIFIFTWMAYLDARHQYLLTANISMAILASGVLLATQHAKQR